MLIDLRTSLVCLLWFGVLAGLTVPLQGQTAQPPALHAAISSSLQGFVDSREIAGAVTVVLSSDAILDVGVVGQQDIAGGLAMREDTIFWIASMTKPITGIAVLMLEEEGKLRLEDNVAQYLPEFAQLKNREGEKVQVTLKELLTHSAGLSELSGTESAQLRTLAELTALVATKPVQFPAGSKWQYSQTAINTAARVVEVVSGQTFPEFVEQRIFAPLQMKDTTFYLSQEQLPRLAKSYRRTEEGQLQEAALMILAGKSPGDTDRVPLANGGLFSTAGDYARFCQMLLGRGRYQGAQLLKSDTVARFATVHSGSLQTGFTPGNGWGVGCCIVLQPQGVTEHLSPGSFGHGGAYGTQAWIDPERDRAYVLMVQRANFPNSDASPVRAAFQAAAQ